MKRKHKRYSKPKRPFDKKRIDEEAVVKKDFGLKNKKEIWKAEAKIKSIRNKAKKLISGNEADKKLFFDRLKKMGLEVNSIGDVLLIETKDFLNRRLQTIVAKKRIAPTVKTARQMITHKKIFIGDRIVNVPSYVVSVNEENKIKAKTK